MAAQRRDKELAEESLDTLTPGLWEVSTPVARDAVAEPEADAPRSKDLSAPLPRVVGPYRILSRLGVGGMGEVLLGYDETLSRRIALKRIRPDRAAERELRRRFEVEARLTALLQHPSIIPVYHVAEETGGTFYTMRPVEGQTLGQLIAQLREDEPAVREEWPTGRLVRLFLQAANAVAYAHSRGVLHRDLKPANIMIGPFEEVLVLDWGMAKYAGGEPVEMEADAVDPALESLETDTASKTLVGTPAYMAPEQLHNEAADFRAEVFSLGIILYELLALRLPWKGRTIGELLEAMVVPPPDPSLLQPGRNIPAPLGEVVLRALDPDPDRRFPTVRAFSTAVAHSLEGRARWKPQHADPLEDWRLADGRISSDGRQVTLRSRGSDRRFRYFCPHRLPGNSRVVFDLRLRRGSELAVWLNTSLTRQHAVEDGYCLQLAPGRRRTVSLLRSGRVVAGARSQSFEPRRWYRVVASREREKVSLQVEGVEIYAFNDPIPLTGSFVGLTGRSSGVELRDLRVFSRGADAKVSCLSIPDAFFNRGLYEEARSEYEAIVASHPGRNEGRLARYRSGLSMVEMARREEDPEIRSMLLDEARTTFVTSATTDSSCLMSLGRAIVASELGEYGELHAALAAALAEYPEDPHRLAIHEWILGRLHALEVDDRQAISALVPLAILHSMEGWGRRVVRELVIKVRSSWETPSFLVGRGRFRENDPGSHAEAVLFFAFWAGRTKTIDTTTRQLLAHDQLRVHHVSDAVLALLELDDPERAETLLNDVASSWQRAEVERGQRVLALSRASVLAVKGELEEAAGLLAEAAAGPVDRAANSARLLLAHAAFAAGRQRLAFRAMRRRGGRDYFAREHLAWLALLAGDPARAERELRPMVERGDHQRGRNLCNFLHGSFLVSQGRETEAQRVFSGLPASRWPRTWTLGSYYASGRLGAGGASEEYLRRAFPWERKCLRLQCRLLERAAELAAGGGGG